MAKIIAFDQTAQEAMRRGVQKLARTVRVTLGPRGRNVIIEKSFGSPTVTKDGVTVAREIELEDKFEARQQQNNARIEELQAKLMEKEALETLEKRRQSLIKSGKASSDEDVEKIEKIMLEKGIQNHETAADYWQWMNKASEPTGQAFYNPNVLNETARDTLSKFWKNPQRAARDEAVRAMQDLRKGTRIGL